MSAERAVAITCLPLPCQVQRRQPTLQTWRNENARTPRTHFCESKLPKLSFLRIKVTCRKPRRFFWRLQMQAVSSCAFSSVFAARTLSNSCRRRSAAELQWILKWKGSSSSASKAAKKKPKGSKRQAHSVKDAGKPEEQESSRTPQTRTGQLRGPETTPTI